MPSWFNPPPDEENAPQVVASLVTDAVHKQRLYAEYYTSPLLPQGESDPLPVLTAEEELEIITDWGHYWHPAAWRLAADKRVHVGPAERLEIARAVDPRISEHVILLMEIAAGEHLGRQAFAPKRPPADRLRLLVRAGKEIDAFRRTLSDLAEEYSWHDAFDTAGARSDLQALGDALRELQNWEDRAAKQGRPSSSARTSLIRWMVELLGRSGVKVSAGADGVVARCVAPALRAAGEPVPADMKPVLRRPVAIERARQRAEGRQLFPFAIRVFGETPEEEHARVSLLTEAEDLAAWLKRAEPEPE